MVYLKVCRATCVLTCVRLPPMKPARTSSGFGAVAIEGESMAPTYRHGDWLLVRWIEGLSESALKIGGIYVIEREEQPGVLYIKRLQKTHGKLVWCEGDNPASQDSRSWGWLPHSVICGKVLFRYRRARRG